MASITDRPHLLRLRSEHLDDWVLISVEDAGTGIDPEHAERMFDPFFTTKPNGIGLGLPICRSTVEAHGGRLSVFPVHPYGSVFQVMLPAATNMQRPARVVRRFEADGANSAINR
jgi:two-component system, LuxR family, sensor kinase FixL